MLVLLLKILLLLLQHVPAAWCVWREQDSGEGFQAFIKKMVAIPAALVAIAVTVIAVTILVADHRSQAAAVATAQESEAKTQQELQALRESSAEMQRNLREAISEAQRGREEAINRLQRIEDVAAETVAIVRERERNPGLTVEEALSLVAGELRDLEDQLSGVKMYGEVAELNVLGEHQLAEGANGIGWNSPLFRAMEGTWDERDGEYRPRCSRDSLTKLSGVAERFSSFPFSHLALAMCARRVGDVRWRQHAHRATEILKHTAQIAGSHPHHAASYRLLQSYLTEAHPRG